MERAEDHVPKALQEAANRAEGPGSPMWCVGWPGRPRDFKLMTGLGKVVADAHVAAGLPPPELVTGENL